MWGSPTPDAPALSSCVCKQSHHESRRSNILNAVRAAAVSGLFSRAFAALYFDFFFSSHHWTLSSSPTGPHPPLRLGRRPNRGHIGGAPSAVLVYCSFYHEWVKHSHPRQQRSRVPSRGTGYHGKGKPSSLVAKKEHHLRASCPQPALFLPDFHCLLVPFHRREGRQRRGSRCWRQP